LQEDVERRKEGNTVNVMKRMHSPPLLVVVALVEVVEAVEVLLEPPPPLSSVVVPLPGMREGVSEIDVSCLL